MPRYLKIALQTAAELDFPMPVGSTLTQLWQAADAAGKGADGHTAIFAFLEQYVGKEEKG